MKVRHTSNHTPCSAQSRSLRQQVAGEGKSGGRSRQRAPLFKTHKMPSTTARLSIGGRPPLADGLVLGNSGSILRHCCSLNNGFRLTPQVNLTRGFETTFSQENSAGWPEAPE
jgi:hypothetical protein